MLPIRQILNALPTSALNRTAKAVLIEVCRLAELDAQGWCTALNPYLVTCLGGTERTMTRALTLLEQRGLLVSKGQGKARRLAPTPTLRACYASADEATRHAALAALNLDKSGAQPRQNEPGNLDISGVNLDTNLDKTGSEHRQNDEVEAEQPRQKWSTNLDKSGAQPRQNGSRVYGDQEDQVITSTPPTPSEWAGAQKKIADLEAENLKLKADLLKLVPPVAATPQKPAPVSPPRLTTYRDYDGAWPEQFAPLFQSPAYLAAWALWGKYLDEVGKPHRGHSHEKTDQAELGRMAAGSEQRAIDIINQTISAGWKRLIDHKPTDNPGKPKFGQPAPPPARAGGSPSQAAAYRPR